MAAIRQWMVDLRKAKEMTMREMAEKCECTKTLLLMIEEHGAITHPRIAVRIAEEYGITDVALYNSLIPTEYATTKIPARQSKPDPHMKWKDIERIFKEKKKTKGNWLHGFD